MGLLCPLSRPRSALSIIIRSMLTPRHHPRYIIKAEIVARSMAAGIKTSLETTGCSTLHRHSRHLSSPKANHKLVETCLLPCTENYCQAKKSMS